MFYLCRGEEKTTVDYLSDISSILTVKNFSHMRFTDLLKNLFEILSDDKKEQLLRVMMSIREYDSLKNITNSLVILKIDKLSLRL
ncbi:MAG TPA: hypothetical protein PKI14_14465 [Fervidobacterium sp.]|nr:hypothetical protein [Fervidobacterium sp.]